TLATRRSSFQLDRARMRRDTHPLAVLFNPEVSRTTNLLDWFPVFVFALKHETRTGDRCIAVNEDFKFISDERVDRRTIRFEHFEVLLFVDQHASLARVDKRL